jgi:hypothetical protein
MNRHMEFSRSELPIAGEESDRPPGCARSEHRAFSQLDPIVGIERGWGGRAAAVD